jgi:hypothetical protein
MDINVDTVCEHVMIVLYIPSDIDLHTHLDMLIVILVVIYE